MEINEDLIKHIATLARLKLTEKEVKEFTPQLKEVLEFFSKLSEVNTDAIEIQAQPVEMKNVMREDKIEASITQEDALKNTEHKKDGYFKGPRAV
jgi:aspartyl-tRNA(Asn)/glutamyl-tRNA(Gln) amidotransferase subunit C